MSGRTIVFALAAALLGGCSTGLLYYPKVNEQVISLSKGDLEAAGIAFMTPSTVTGQEQEKEAVALTFTDILKAERPGLKVIPLAGTLGAVNKAGLSETYRRMYEDYRDTGLFPGEALRRVGAATGTRYLAQLKLQNFKEDSKNRFGLFGFRLVDTQFADLRLFFQIWDTRDGSIAWEAMQELRITRESTTEEPLMLRRLVERSAQELIAKLP
jgi:hypothetical protein